MGRASALQTFLLVFPGQLHDMAALPGCSRKMQLVTSVRLSHTLRARQLPHPVSPPPTSPEPSTGVDQARWFAEELRPHEPALRAYLHRRYPGVSDVDDFVQESFLKALRARKAGRLTSVRGFLFQVAHNAAVSFFRKRKFISSTPVNELGELRVLESDANVVEAVCTRDELELVAATIVELPSRCHEIVRLRLLHGMDYREIAQRLSLSEATVRVQIARGMKKCSELLHSRGIRPENNL